MNIINDCLLCRCHPAIFSARKIPIYIKLDVSNATCTHPRTHTHIYMYRSCVHFGVNYLLGGKLQTANRKLQTKQVQFVKQARRAPHQHTEVQNDAKFAVFENGRQTENRVCRSQRQRFIYFSVRRCAACYNPLQYNQINLIFTQWSFCTRWIRSRFWIFECLRRLRAAWHSCSARSRKFMRRWEISVFITYIYLSRIWRARARFTQITSVTYSNLPGCARVLLSCGNFIFKLSQIPIAGKKELNFFMVNTRYSQSELIY